VCSYRLSIVTISLSLMAAICNANSRAQTPFGERGGRRESAMVLFDNQW